MFFFYTVHCSNINYWWLTILIKRKQEEVFLKVQCVGFKGIYCQKWIITVRLHAPWMVPFPLLGCRSSNFGVFMSF